MSRHRTPARKKGSVRSGARAPLDPHEAEFERTLGWLFLDIHRLLSKQFEMRMRHLGLTRPQWRVLLNLVRGEGITQTELAERCEMEKAPLGKILDKLDEAGWIKRKADPKDRRARRVHLTGKLERHARDLLAAARDTIALALHGMREHEVQEFVAELQRVKKNLGGVDEESAPPSN